MQKLNYEVDILVNGRPIKEYAHEGKTFIEGKKGTEFSLKLKNNSWSRKLFIVSIDGLSVIDGKDASYNSSGYIVPANSSMTIDGWRVSDKEVAKFYFSDDKKSYGSKKGKGKNLGVVGVVVFDEKITSVLPDMFTVKPWKSCNGTPWNYDSGTITWTDGNGNGTSRIQASAIEDVGVSAFYCSSTTNYKSAPTQKVKQELGTGWGNYKSSEVTTVDFDKQSDPETIFEIFYNTKEQLEKMGVEFKKPVYLSPQAFPGQYCEPPQN